MKLLRVIPESMLRGKKVFVRCDFNVPLENGKVKDDTRIKKALPTIEYLIEKGAKITLASHLGRPKGEKKPELSLLPVAKRLSELLEKDVEFAEDCIGDEVSKKIEALSEGDVLLLENLRFYKGEEKNDEDFAKSLATPFDVYINDAFGTAHRKHASTYGMAKYFNVKGAGFLLEKEVHMLTEILENPEKPFVVILGGAKVKDKIGIIENLLDRADVFVIGGGMAYTFLKATGKKIGNSLFDEKHFDKVKEFLEKGKEKFVLPVDHVVVSSLSDLSDLREVEEIEEGYMGVDIGRKTIRLFEEKIKNAKTIFWNGPMGVFEKNELAKGTVEIANSVRDATGMGAKTVIGGGDTVSAIHVARLHDEDFTHVSTGGGATLEFLAGIKLPGIEALE